MSDFNYTVCKKQRPFSLFIFIVHLHLPTGSLLAMAWFFLNGHCKVLIYSALIPLSLHGGLGSGEEKGGEKS